jgi:hypothetical protein
MKIVIDLYDLFTLAAFALIALLLVRGCVTAWRQSRLEPTENS